jgi:zinc protease
MVVTTLSYGPLDAAIEKQPSLASFAAPVAKTDAAASGAPNIEFLVQKSPSRQLDIKLQFLSGSANDPKGKEGLAAIAADMITEAGSSQMRIDEIEKRLFPIAGGFGARVDREMTTFSGSIHADNLAVFADTVLPQLLSPGWREEDFSRIKQTAHNNLVQDLRTNNDEELGKEALQAAIFAGSGYGHPAQGTVAGIDSITLEDVKKFVAENYTRANLIVALAGDVPEEFQTRLKRDLGVLPQGSASGFAKTTYANAGDVAIDANSRGVAHAGPAAHMPNGIEVDIIAKETRATSSAAIPISSRSTSRARGSASIARR